MSQSSRNSARMSAFEFVVLVATMISLVAMSIDAMLPALPQIADDLGVSRVNDSQFVIGVFFVGMGVGQMLFGPMSDSLGRRPAILLGMGVFAAGCLLSIFASTFEQMLFGRLLQGVGAAGPRIVSIALVRDQYKGREMARIMSFVMTIFILVPVFAPAIGQLALSLAGWRSIFIGFLMLVLLTAVWFWIRQPETLPADRRVRFSLPQLWADIRGICGFRAALGYTLTMGFVFGAFVGYLSSAQQIFQVQYRLQEQFPLYFGILACAIGVASLCNARLVMRFGMRRLSNYALAGICLISGPFYLYSLVLGGHPPLEMLMLYLMPLFFFFGVLFGNLNALAMEPLGHIAGLGSALVGSVSTLISVVFGAWVADAYDGSVLPLVSGFALLGLVGLGTMRWTQAGLAAEA